MLRGPAGRKAPPTVRPLPRVAVLLCALCAAAALAAPGLETIAASPRRDHSAVLLRDGTVLVLGGSFIADGGHVAQVERFAPWLGWVDAGTNPLANQSSDLRSAMLHDGRVLVVGQSVVFYEPGSGLFRSNTTLPLQVRRSESTLTVLNDGRVLLAGGVDYSVSDGGSKASLPFVGTVGATGDLTWTPVGNATPALRRKHTATLLRDGRVLLIGGSDPDSTTGVDGFATFNVGAGNDFMLWVDGGFPQGSTRNLHSTVREVNGAMVVMGNELGPLDQYWRVDPAGGNNFTVSTLMRPSVGGRIWYRHAAVLATDNDVVSAGGFEGAAPFAPVKAVSKFLRTSYQNVTALPDMAAFREGHTATLLMDGKILVVGGNISGGPSWEIIDPLGFSFVASAGSSLIRNEAVGVPLPSGKILLSGGRSTALQTGQMLAVLDANGGASPVATPIPLRYGHTATMLNTDEVLIVGGVGRASGASLSDCWLVDVHDAGTRACPPMTVGRTQHTATLLADGRVLVAGGYINGGISTDSAEIFDPGGPAGGRWIFPRQLSSSRAEHAAVLLPNGNVLLSGGRGGADSSEYFLPLVDGGTAVPGPPMTQERLRHTMTLMRDGRVLVTGGESVFLGAASDTIEILGFDGGWAPARNVGAQVQQLTEPATRHGAVALPTGDVVIAGGAPITTGLFAHRFSPLTDQVQSTMFPLADARKSPVVLLNNDGKVLVIDGALVPPNPIQSFAPFGDITSGLDHGLTALEPLVSEVTGEWRFRLGGNWKQAPEASSGGAQNSAVNVPRLLFQRLDNGQVIAPNGYSYFADAGELVGAEGPMPQGQYRAWAYVSGVPGLGAWFRVGARNWDGGSSDGGNTADGGTLPDGGALPDGGNPSSDGGTLYRVVVSFPAQPDPKLVGIPVAARVQLFAPAGTPGAELKVAFKTSEGLELCQGQTCPAPQDFALRGSGILDDTGQSLTVMVRPGVSGSHRLHATLTHQAVQVEGEATFTADGFELGSGLCGCSSAGGLGAVALLALALRRRRRA